MNVGDYVMISPDLTNDKDWTSAEVIEVEENSFVGEVVSAKTQEGVIYFGQSDLFKSADPVCMR